MSQWNKIEPDDIDIDPECLEVNILAGSDDWGNIYAVLTFSQIKEIAEKIDNA